MNKLQLAQDRLSVKRRELAEIFAAGGEDLNLSTEQVDEIKSRNTEIEAIATEVESLRSADDIARKNREAITASEQVNRLPFGDGAPAAQKSTEVKSLGDLFIESDAYTKYNSANSRSPVAVADAQLKTLLSTGAGFAPQAIRTGQVIDSAQPNPSIVDVIPATTTTQTAVVFMQETTYTSGAAEIAEGATYGESALAYTEVSSPVRKIAVFLPVTDEQLQDVDAMRDRVNGRLLLQLRQRVAAQIIAGNGTAPNLKGLLNTSGILTQARGTDPQHDAIFKGIVKVQTTDFSDPSAVLMHPLDWQTIRLMRTADGLYIFGNPGDSGVQRVWGLPVVTSTYVTQGTSVVADFAGYTELAYKAGIEFETSNSHSTFFAEGKLAIRAQLRAALVVYRASAICQVTGL